MTHQTLTLWGEVKGILCEEWQWERRILCKKTNIKQRKILTANNLLWPHLQEEVADGEDELRLKTVELDSMLMDEAGGNKMEFGVMELVIV